MKQSLLLPCQVCEFFFLVKWKEDEKMKVKPISKTVEDFLEERKRKEDLINDDLPESLRKRRKSTKTIPEISEWG